jgi:pimeloyl-ACP methyl ester carboxylesterase
MRLEERARRIAPPVLLVYGRRDRLAGARDGERLAAAIPRAELLLLEGTAHYGIAFHPEALRRTAGWLGAHGEGAT